MNFWDLLVRRLFFTLVVDAYRPAEIDTASPPTWYVPDDREGWAFCAFQLFEKATKVCGLNLEAEPGDLNGVEELSIQILRRIGLECTSLQNMRIYDLAEDVGTARGYSEPAPLLELLREVDRDRFDILNLPTFTRRTSIHLYIDGLITDLCWVKGRYSAQNPLPTQHSRTGNDPETQLRTEVLGVLADHRKAKGDGLHFPERLYRRLVRDALAAPSSLPPAWLHPIWSRLPFGPRCPSWFAPRPLPGVLEDETERRFLRACYVSVPKWHLERLAVFLGLYGCVPIRNVARLMSAQHNSQHGRPKGVLVESWATTPQGLARRMRDFYYALFEAMGQN